MSEKLFSPGDQPLDLVSQCDKLNKKSDLKKKKNGTLLSKKTLLVYKHKFKSN